jgi:hypothetical protein
MDVGRESLCVRKPGGDSSSLEWPAQDAESPNRIEGQSPTKQRPGARIGRSLETSLDGACCQTASCRQCRGASGSTAQNGGADDRQHARFGITEYADLINCRSGMGASATSTASRTSSRRSSTHSMETRAPVIQLALSAAFRIPYSRNGVRKMLGTLFRLFGCRGLSARHRRGRGGLPRSQHCRAPLRFETQALWCIRQSHVGFPSFRQSTPQRFADPASRLLTSIPVWVAAKTQVRSLFRRRRRKSCARERLTTARSAGAFQRSPKKLVLPTRS